MAAEGEIKTCEECGATIYPEHLEQHSAGHWHGKMLCPHCWAERKELAAMAESRSGAVGGDPETIAPPIDLVTDDAPPTSEKSAAIRTFGGGGITFDRQRETQIQYRRTLLPDPGKATRCRTFHCKLNDASMAHLDEQINAWIDEHDEVEVKFAVSNIGVVEGKHADPHLVVTLFY